MEKKKENKKIVLHCSDSTFGNAAVITNWHIQRGWQTIGYHFVICNGHLNKNFYNEKFGWPN